MAHALRHAIAPGTGATPPISFRRLALPVLMLVAIAAALLAAGCAGTPGTDRSTDSAPAADADRSRDADRPPPWDLFRPLDLPTPTLVRLGSGAPGPGYWQQRADYAIDARLDPENRRVSASLTLVYTNSAPEALEDFWLHLEQNLFREDSVGALSKPRGARFGFRSPGTRTGYDITRVEVLDAQEAASWLDAGASPDRAPRAGTPVTLVVLDTVGRIDLPSPIPARGGRLALRIDYSFGVPAYAADRHGIEEVRDGVIFQLAQWFPAACKYDDVNGWNNLPYLGQGEFYTDFGDYTVRITVPASHVVAAAGELQNPQQVLTEDMLARWHAARTSTDQPVVIRYAHETGAQAAARVPALERTWIFQARDVRTFAWASSDAFIWDGMLQPGAGPEGSPGVFVQSFYPVEASETVDGKPGPWNDSTPMLAHAIEHLSQQWARYPYPTASNVNGIVGGMEYPMVLFCRARRDARPLYGVTTHEIAHNWFPMVVNSDERRHAWMDEGFASFTDIYSNASYWNESPQRDMREFGRRLAAAGMPPVITPPDAIPGRALGATQYGKVATALFLLREVVLGPDRFDHAFRTYIRRWSFKSPQPADFFRTMNEAAGMDLDWFWRGWFFTNAALDQSVEGFSRNEEDGTVAVDFRNNLDMAMPVLYRVTYDDGSTEDRVVPAQAWATTHEWRAQWDPQGRTIARVEIDPDARLPDADPSNNIWPR